MPATATGILLISLLASQAPGEPPSAPLAGGVQAEPAPAAPIDGSYRVGTDDLLTIAVLQAPELNSTPRVSAAGEISLPLIGVVTVSGLRPPEIETLIKERLSEKYIRDPQVSVQVTETPSHVVSVVGSVRKPGLYQIRGTKTVLEVLALAEGVTADAGDRVIVMPNETGLAGAGPDDRAVSVALEDLLAGDSAANIEVHPGDVVKVGVASTFYLVGEIKKPGAFPILAKDHLTILRALAIGEGLTPMAARNDSIILRTDAAGRRTEIPLQLDRILAGKDPDLALQANDLVFIPQSGGKAFARGTLETLTRILTLRPVF